MVLAGVESGSALKLNLDCESEKQITIKPRGRVAKWWVFFVVLYLHFDFTGEQKYMLFCLVTSVALGKIGSIFIMVLNENGNKTLKGNKKHIIVVHHLLASMTDSFMAI